MYEHELIAGNHSLIHGFLNDNNLDEQEYYDLCAIALCKAALEYDRRKSKFSTYAYKCMENAVLDQLRRENREKRNYAVCSLQDVSDELPHPRNFENDVILKVIVQEKAKVMTEDERFVLSRLLDDYSVREIAAELGCSTQNVYEIRKRLREKLNDIW